MQISFDRHNFEDIQMETDLFCLIECIWLYYTDFNWNSKVATYENICTWSEVTDCFMDELFNIAEK